MNRLTSLGSNRPGSNNIASHSIHEYKICKPLSFQPLNQKDNKNTALSLTVSYKFSFFKPILHFKHRPILLGNYVQHIPEHDIERGTRMTL
ncbi:hypothetical protein ERO13_D06G179750v2 [Gossypium hirsutum]|uniref:Uncharacterized protein n=2 Tax=Gossypium TaxID=3633 RepID=A0A5J5R4I0_GOSBA|nr:hypothetical protein ES319_D06G212800v1 [Gossypium barbadense]KAG4143287.1 hypothetical protein ERO13_D06G179750v2 [Gossypium hirsutum]TYI78454.1 hypothetical protein E1A91_D06G213000v1 [Gossypium mustelinum]